jgi:23S rRNA (cytosine1962-C5)-methyltransferase
VDRPSTGADAEPRDRPAWARAHLRWDRESGWIARTPESLGAWHVEIAGLRLELRPTAAGQVGLFPEHASQLDWLERGVADRAAGSAPAVLNLFAHTGLATLALARAGAVVAHVDAARPSVAWARHNAELSGLADRPTRWLVDDAAAFVRREARRGRRYAGLVLDPPSYGHGGSTAWQLEAELRPLLESCREVLEPDAFVLLTAHTPGFGSDRLATELATGLGRPPAAVDAGDLALEARSGATLRLGAFARLAG